MTLRRRLRLRLQHLLRASGETVSAWADTLDAPSPATSEAVPSDGLPPRPARLADAPDHWYRLVAEHAPGLLADGEPAEHHEREGETVLASGATSGDRGRPASTTPRPATQPAVVAPEERTRPPRSSDRTSPREAERPRPGPESPRHSSPDAARPPADRAVRAEAVDDTPTRRVRSSPETPAATSEVTGGPDRSTTELGTRDRGTDRRGERQVASAPETRRRIVPVRPTAPPSPLPAPAPSRAPDPPRGGGFDEPHARPHPGRPVAATPEPVTPAGRSTSDRVRPDLDRPDLEAAPPAPGARGSWPGIPPVERPGGGSQGSSPNRNRTSELLAAWRDELEEAQEELGWTASCSS